jgi:hypothetical protein
VQVLSPDNLVLLRRQSRTMVGDCPRSSSRGGALCLCVSCGRRSCLCSRGRSSCPCSRPPTEVVAAHAAPHRCVLPTPVGYTHPRARADLAWCVCICGTSCAARDVVCERLCEVFYNWRSEIMKLPLVTRAWSHTPSSLLR